MLATDSPFLRLPVDLPRRQVLFTDALRLSAEMAWLSFRSLEALLKSLVVGRRGDAAKGVAVEAIGYAYGIVDAANRFREVLRAFPGLKQNAVFHLFIRQTAPVETLRDVVPAPQRRTEQHCGAAICRTWDNHLARSLTERRVPAYSMDSAARKLLPRTSYLRAYDGP